MDPSTTSLHHQAIEAALNSRWDEALKLNKVIIKDDPQNIDALNRLARANFEIGRLNQAQKYYSLALKFDPYNPIAIKNLRIIKAFKKNGVTSPKANNHQSSYNGHASQILSSIFLQEPGRTKIVSLIKVAEPQKISRTYCGMPVDMIVKSRKLTVLNKEGIYLGVIPDDISFHLLKLIKGKNRYEVYIKAVKFNGLTVLIREVFRSKRFRNQPSFLEHQTLKTSSDLIHSLEDDSEPEEDTEPEEQEG